jgi:hypothetical protein
MEKITPITPEECAKKELPAFVIKAANNCIKRNYYMGVSEFNVDELVDEIIRTSNDKDFKENTTFEVHFCDDKKVNDETKRKLIIKNKWHFLGETYRKVGWTVKPWNSTYKFIG